MTVTDETAVPLRHADRFFIDGGWVDPFFGRHDRRDRLHHGGALLPCPRGPAGRHRPRRDGGPPGLRRRALAPDEPRRTGRLPQGHSRPDCATGPRTSGRSGPGESGALHLIARHGAAGIAGAFEYYAGLAETFPFEERVQPSQGEFGLLVREPVGVVGAIIPWNAPIGLITYKIAPALLAGCTVVLKCSPEAPGDAYVVAEIAEAIGLPAGRAERGHRRQGGLRTPRPGRPRGQDHLHRFDRRRPADRLHLR